MKLQLIKNEDEFNKWLEIACFSLFPVNEKPENIYIEPDFREEMLYNFKYTLTVKNDFVIKFGPAVLLALKNDEDNIIGTVCIRKDYHKHGACQINNIAIHPEFRGQGYGKLLIDKTAEMVLGHSDYNYITLTTDSAREFYRHIGLEFAGMLDFGEKKRYFFYKKIR